MYTEQKKEETGVKCRVWMSILVLFCLLTGCGTTVQEKSTSEENKNETLGLTPDFSYEMIEQVPGILINQIGYLEDEKKVGIFQGKNLEESFYIYNVKTGRQEYQGSLKQGSFTESRKLQEEDNTVESHEFYLADFSDFKKTGRYYLYHSDLGYSYEFEIGNKVYLEMEKLILSDIEEEKNNTALMCYQLTGLLVTQELYKEYISEPERLERICRQKAQRLLMAQDEITGSVYADISEIAKIQQLNVAEKQQYISLAATAEFSGVMAAYAYRFRETEPSLSEQYQEAAEKAYRSIQTSLDNVGYDAGYFAATQLYRLTGKAKYHQAIDQYLLLKEEQKSYTEYDFSLFADYTYLSISYGVNLEWSDFIMKKIMKQAEEISLTSGKNSYYVSTKREYNDINGKLRDMSNLALVNYIITNHEYSVLQKNYLDYFLGRNPENICFVDGLGTRNAKEGAKVDETNGALFYLLMQSARL